MEERKMKSSVIVGPWKARSETISRDGGTGSYRTMNYYMAIEKQEQAARNEVYLELYVINNDLNRSFLISCTKERTINQIEARKLNLEEPNLLTKGING
jgi:hypothetical protein